jgi:hypothetical protein
MKGCGQRDHERALSLGVPILNDGSFVGFVGANITVDILSRFLSRDRASLHSTTAIVERGGTIHRLSGQRQAAGPSIPSPCLDTIAASHGQLHLVAPCR